MPRGPLANRATKYNANNHQCYPKKNAYKYYDWRPIELDGESKRPADQDVCDAAELLSSKSSPRCGTHLDIHPAGLPSCPNISPRRHPGRSPCSTRASGENTTLCDYRQCHSSEKFLSRVSSPHNTHGDNCFGKPSQKSNLDLFRDRICLKHSSMAPGMEPAGIITRNYDYPFPPEMHSIVRLDSYVKYQGVYNGLGQMVKESFKPRLGDVIIVKIPRVNPRKDTGYVEFFTAKHQGCHFCPGDLLLRVGKFVKQNTWRYNKRYKLYQRTDEHRWLFIGMIDNFVNLLPVTNHLNINSDHVDRNCRFFYPRRGDMIVHLHPPDRASQLEWFNPKTDIAKGDILVRMYLGEPGEELAAGLDEDLRDVVDSVVEIYMYSGKGFGWIFMGRDNCWYRNGLDLLAG